MRFSVRKAILGIQAVCGLSLLALTPSIADITRGSAQIDASATFTPAAYIMVEHDAFTVPQIRNFLPSNYHIDRKALISIKGIPGEMVMLDCSIEAVDGLSRNLNGSNISNRDCAGTGKTNPRSAVSGGAKILNNVQLTTDLVPAEDGSSDSSITIDVSYM